MLLEVKPDDGRALENVDLGPGGELQRVFNLHQSRDQRRHLQPTGVYLLAPGVLDIIDSDGYVDLKEQLFQRFREAGRPVHGYVLDAPVERIETAFEYLSLNQRLLMSHSRERAAAGPRPDGEISGLRLGKNVRLAESALILGSVTLGDNCEIAEPRALQPSSPAAATAGPGWWRRAVRATWLLGDEQRRGPAENILPLLLRL